MLTIYFFIGWLVFMVLALAVSGVSSYNVEQKALGEKTNQSFWTKVVRWWHSSNRIRRAVNLTEGGEIEITK